MIQANLRWLMQTLGSDVIDNIHFNDQVNDKTIVYVSTDSRTIEAGQVFIALTGMNFDGAQFIAQVKDKGAIAVVTQTLVPEVDIPQILVNDTLKAYGKIASRVAQESNVTTIAITGSVGKTSVKEMCSAILSHYSESNRVLATHGNFNNEVGVPHTLMRFTPEHDYAVVELGANHIGEIAYTTSLTKPDVAVLNNAAEAHLEGFGSLMGVVQAKGEIFQGLSEQGIAVVNADSEFKHHWLSKLEQQFKEPNEHILQFSTDHSFAGKKGYVVADNIHLNAIGCASFDLIYEQQSVSVSLPIAGKHNVANALSAAAACIAIKVPLEVISAGLQTMQLVSGRVELHQVSDRLLIIDDSYNANVKSVNAASDLLGSYEGNKILALGDMAELGDEGISLHQLFV